MKCFRTGCTSFRLFGYTISKELNYVRTQGHSVWLKRSGNKPQSVGYPITKLLVTAATLIWMQVALLLSGKNCSISALLPISIVARNAAASMLTIYNDCWAAAAVQWLHCSAADRKDAGPIPAAVVAFWWRQDDLRFTEFYVPKPHTPEISATWGSSTCTETSHGTRDLTFRLHRSGWRCNDRGLPTMRHECTIKNPRWLKFPEPSTTVCLIIISWPWRVKHEQLYRLLSAFFTFTTVRMVHDN